MEIEFLLHSNVQQFIEENKNDTPQDVAFKAHGKFDFPVGFLVDQISGPNKIQKKLPSWSNLEGIVLPPDISLQQCSSEETAKYKAGLVDANTIVDLTGGFGVDVHAFAKQASKVIHIEQNEWLSKVVSHNFQKFKYENVTCLNTTAEQFLITNTGQFDLIYIDPARRSEGGSKVFKFADCVPNVVALKEQLLKTSKQVLIKASPMIDITQGLRELGNVSKVWVVGLKNECKEVLFLLEEGFVGKPEITATELANDKVIELMENRVDLPLDNLKAYLYDPFVAIHKIGAYASYLPDGLNQLAVNTNLFSSSDKRIDFPGRIFKVLHVLKYNKKEVLKALGGKQVNIFTRNFPDKPDAIKKKLGLKDGGDFYLIGFRDQESKPLIALCVLES